MKVSVMILVLLGLVATVPTMQGARILSVFSFPSPSHYIFASGLLKELAERGHEVTSMSPYPQKKSLPNFRDIYLHENVHILDEYFEHVKTQKQKSLWEKKSYISRIMGTMCRNIFENEAVKGLMNSTEEKFDLIIVETLWDESLYGLGQHFNAPMIGVSTFGTIGSIDDVVGNTSPVSYVPHLSLALDSVMSFKERLHNFFMHALDLVHLHLFTLPLQRTIFNKYFPESKLTFEEARTNFSLVLLNQHHSLSYARPYVPNMIDVGGLHLQRKSDPLSQELKEYLDNATDGAIFFSMGSNLKSEDFSQEKRKLFNNVFGSLKQKVLWKFEDTEFENKSDNIYISKWFPQPAVLAHPNVKLFMSHGGLLSITEAIYHAKPILGLPMFADQPKNIAQSKKRGFAVSVNFFELTEDELRTSLLELLYNPTYTKTIQKISGHFHDQPSTAMDTAVYWVEYVLRQGHCLHLRNAGMLLNFWQYHSIDVISTFLAAFLMCLWCAIWTFNTIYAHFYPKHNPAIAEKNMHDMRKLKRG